ncbi:MAG: hypothetical protein A3E88_08195 [Legionellales bacterium RIFCSPHIGHO2_12_FULL_35_11]|nr:MAG: hypothetical protein A3E88_08195 [Legionellales bacterium RIFCSPHIGHO2_12_FULL_35_11]
MQRTYQVLIYLLVAFLTSCSYYQHYVGNEKTLKGCHLACYAVNDKCNETCINTCKNCNAQSFVQAAKRFKLYKHQRCVQGEIVDLELQSFRDPLQCRKTTCSCKDDLRVCMQSCRG